MQERLHNLVSQGFMLGAELTTYCMTEDPVSPAPAEG
jgi:hypothetical protein